REYQVARIGCIAIDFRNITRVKQRCDVLQFCKCWFWTNLIRHRNPGAPANSNQEQCDYEVFHLFSLRWISLCNLCVLCVSVVDWWQRFVNHRDTENTEVAQRKPFLFRTLLCNRLREFVASTFVIISSFRESDRWT